MLPLALALGVSDGSGFKVAEWKTCYVKRADGLPELQLQEKHWSRSVNVPPPPVIGGRYGEERRASCAEEVRSVTVWMTGTTENTLFSAWVPF